ncbi:MAG: heavy-metal-associated domain-containing protein [Ignavibacteria bacterium]|nr:heavy-metal-associated domain-containing protein [Ignavibacteria bacterium]MBT8382508.1 heavy-metal-associated domain-containing protein [Ignavibacteria bacterium]MBT8392515.1 heavy-metal-associated domain-containing protein [Ignavibacteria bacterium]NNJ52076.1 heavy-metal-associated domain-containing protein [Ignavibacteriaceae bacterium]NNL19875.1 heavy-metal-associated domain-containing protein [Ignavibacteriaceae bacterium]
MEKKFKIDGMSCDHCVNAVEDILSKLKLKNFDVKIGSVTIDFEKSSIGEAEIIKAIEEAGYKVID